MNNAILNLQQQIESIDAKIQEHQSLIDSGDELAELAQDEIKQLETQKQALVEAIESMQPREIDVTEDTDDYKDSIIEIRAAAGGDEAGLFAGDLYRIYTRYAEQQGWKVQQLSMSEGGIGNIKEVTFEVKGKNENPSYPLLQFESGVHRVQRVPATESSGRIHTSTATVAVLPKVEPEQLNIQPHDLRIDTFRSSGPGGQSVNTTDSAVRITHIPTGVTVSVQDEKSQHKNREKAMQILSSRLFDMMRRQQQAELSELRMEQIGTGERSEKIRTYNYPQNRVTDHRINESWHQLDRIVEGEVGPVIETVSERLREAKD